MDNGELVNYYLPFQKISLGTECPFVGSASLPTPFRHAHLPVGRQGDLLRIASLSSLPSSPSCHPERNEGSRFFSSTPPDTDTNHAWVPVFAETASHRQAERTSAGGSGRANRVIPRSPGPGIRCETGSDREKQANPRSPIRRGVLLLSGRSCLNGEWWRGDGR